MLSRAFRWAGSLRPQTSLNEAACHTLSRLNIFQTQSLGPLSSSTLMVGAGRWLCCLRPPAAGWNPPSLRPQDCVLCSGSPIALICHPRRPADTAPLIWVSDSPRRIQALRGQERFWFVLYHFPCAEDSACPLQAFGTRLSVARMSGAGAATQCHAASPQSAPLPRASGTQIPRLAFPGPRPGSWHQGCGSCEPCPRGMQSDE